MNCTVEVCDLDGVKHAVQVDADSLYEAAIRGAAALRRSTFVEVKPLMQLTIRVQPPTTTHVVQMSKVEAWLNIARSPKDVALKSRLKELLADSTET